MRRIYPLFLFLFVMISSCQNEPKGLTTGAWWAKMDVSETEILPFNFALSIKADGTYEMEMFNAEETVVVDEFEIQGDSILINMPVFEGYIAGTFSANEIKGEFIKESLNRIVPFQALHGERNRFEVKGEPKVDISGIWETRFDIDTEKEYPAMGIFTQEGSKVKGTFRTKTGDYRYLEGVMDGETMKLSTFDGAHAFLFTAKATDSTLKGVFYSGNHYQEIFEAKRNDAYELPDANTLTFLKEGYDRFDFSFPDADGNMVSLSDGRFKNKPVLVQIMGTWCPNCLDETRFYVDYFEKNPNLDVELVALAFEYAKTEEKAIAGINRLIQREEVTYPILLAQHGTSNKKKANEKLPMLNHVLSYPTTIYIGKNGEVEKIHTGFNGPATGDKYSKFKKEFDETIRALVNAEVEATK